MQRIADILNATSIFTHTDAEGVTAQEEVDVEYLSRTGDISVSVSSQPGTDAKRYVNGGGITEHPFSVYVRAPEKRVPADFDAYAALKAAALVLDAEDGITAVDTPYIVGRDASDNVYWRTDGVLRYRRDSNESEE